MSKKFIPKTVHLTHSGIEKILGELESRVMGLVWESKESTVREVRDEIAKRYKDLSFNAVMTIMNRLVGKGLLQKRRVNKMYRYMPVVAEDAFKKMIAGDIITSVVHDPALFSAASFADIAESLDIETIKKLRKFDQK